VTTAEPRPRAASASDRPVDVPVNVLAPILGWLVPGLGHWRLGHRRRGLLVFAGVAGLYLGGLLVGGLDVIDRRGDPWWYCGQVLVGPITPAVNWWRETHPPPADPEDPDPGFGWVRPSFSHVNEIGTLYTTIAGMLNLIAILDAVVRRRTEDERAETEADGASAD